MSTHIERISAYMAARSAEYRNAWVGLKVIYTTPAGKRVRGTITGWAHQLPVATLTDGTPARLKSSIEVLP